ncbi:hypothetical protein M569_00679, partial [Genlisea aurea]
EDKKHSEEDDDEKLTPDQVSPTKQKDIETTSEVKESNAEEAIPPALDLDGISQEIDGFISTLSNSDDSSSPEVPICLEQYAVLVEAKIGEYDSGDNPVRWSSLAADDTTSFIEAIERLSSLSKVLSGFASDFRFAHPINRIGGVLQLAMSYVEEEFKILLEIHESNPEEPEQMIAESESEPPAAESSFPGYSDEISSGLARLSSAMITGGYETECSQAYLVARRNALEESLKKIGFERYSIDEVQKMQWDTLEREIVSWIKTCKEFTAVHFSMERKLSEIVFSGHPSAGETVFRAVSGGVMYQLLNFVEAVAMTKRAAEKLFKFLDIYEALRDALPATENLFPEEVKTEAAIIKARLGEAMIMIFLELENSIKADSGKTPVPGGSIHPLTRYTMNYLKYACEYKDTMEQIFREHQKIERSDSVANPDFEIGTPQNNPEPPETDDSSAKSMDNNNSAPQSSPFHDQMVKAMDLLDANLEAKSKLYRDPSLRSIFMMNNGRYILQKVKGSSEIHNLMGDSWIRKRSSDLRQFHKGYQRETWNKLLNCLHPEGLTSHGKVAKPVLKERFKSFNAIFDEIHKTQSNWIVSDEQLQSELRVSISNMVIPAYRSFLGRYGQVFTPGRQTEKYVKYQSEDIEACIDELFDGAAAAQGKKKL